MNYRSRLCSALPYRKEAQTFVFFNPPKEAKEKETIDTSRYERLTQIEGEEEDGGKKKKKKNLYSNLLREFGHVDGFNLLKS